MNITNKAKTLNSWWSPPNFRLEEDNSIERHATWLELFYDLIFVAVIGKIAHSLSLDLSFSGIIGFLILFIAIWWSWLSSTLYSTRFDTDDPFHRLITGIQMFFIVILAINIHDGLGKTSASFAFAYAFVRILNVIEYHRALRSAPRTRKLTNRFVKSFGLISIIWLVSAFVPIQLRFVLWFIALIIDFLTPILLGQLSVQFPPSTSYLPERFGLFIIIVLGELVIGIINGVVEQPWNFPLVVSLGLGMSITFSLWWIYFDNLGGAAIESARSCSQRLWSYQLWLYMHLPLAMSIAATGIGIEKVISKAQDLVLPDTERWLICSAVAICLFTLGIINLTGLIASNQKRHCKFRIGYRFSSSILMIIIAIAGVNLSAVQVIGLIALICTLQIALELHTAVISLKPNPVDNYQ